MGATGRGGLLMFGVYVGRRGLVGAARAGWILLPHQLVERLPGEVRVDAEIFRERGDVGRGLERDGSGDHYPVGRRLGGSR